MYKIIKISDFLYKRKAVISGGQLAASWAEKSSTRVALLAKDTLDIYVAVGSLQTAGLVPIFLNWQLPMATLVSCSKTSFALCGPASDKSISPFTCLSGSSTEESAA